jgi:hypothetical protein
MVPREMSKRGFDGTAMDPLGSTTLISNPRQVHKPPSAASLRRAIVFIIKPCATAVAMRDKPPGRNCLSVLPNRCISRRQVIMAQSLLAPKLLPPATPFRFAYCLIQYPPTGRASSDAYPLHVGVCGRYWSSIRYESGK